jgi:hypothetical protein
LVDQLSVPLRDFVKDFRANSANVLQQVREGSPEKTLELSTKLASLVATLRPEPSEMSKARSADEIAIALLKSVGLAESQITEDMIQSAIEANETLIARLEQIRDAAQV